MQRNTWLHDFLKWRIKHLSDQRFLIFLSIIIGVIMGLSAALLKTIIFYIEKLLQTGFFNTYQGILYFIFPLIGIFSVVLFIKYLANNHFPNGVSYVIFNIGKRNGIFKPIHTFAHVITSGITVAFGGSVGLEGPAVLTGSAIGSNLSQVFHLNSKKRLLLIGCGSAAAISALFNSPIAGVIFVLEVILVETKLTFIIPLLIASVSGTLMSKILMGESLLFEFGTLSPFELKDIPFYVLLGTITGLLSIYFMKVSEFLNKTFGQNTNRLNRFYLNGSLLGLMLFLFPVLYGEGFYVIRQILKGNESLLFKNDLYQNFIGLGDIVSENWFVLLFLAISVLLKVFATNFTQLAGGNGGVFAPSLFIGGITGFLLANLINMLNIGIQVPVINFTLVGMSGVVAGLMHTPLTAIFLIAEISQGYELFVPLMIVAAISYASSTKRSAYSFFTRRLAEQGELTAYDKDKNVLSEIGVLKAIEKDLITVNESGNLKNLIDAISKSNRNIFPVVNDQDELKGIILLDDVRHLIFDPEKYDISLRYILHAPPAFVNYDEKMDTVMEKFDQTGAWNLPVLKDGKYYGFLSKSKIFTIYRDQLSQQ